MNILKKNWDNILTKYSLKLTKLHHFLKNLSCGHASEPPSFASCKLELRIGGIFLPRNRPTLVLKCNLRAHNCWISLSEGTTVDHPTQ